ncbi:MAG: hypothetical protein NTZ90_06735 [Proteobacteria bacterium]|nr:hypothetical protein [Pseudomonadota bacterium]
MTKLMLVNAVSVCCAGWLLSSAAYGKADPVPHLPDEYETTSGHGIAMNNAGYAQNDGFTAVRANPALLSTQRDYTVSAGYHWPTAGRDYFQAGVVDAKTSPVAAGVSYTGYTDDFSYPVDPASAKATGASLYDSPVTRRASIAVASVFGQFSLGLGGTYVEAHPAPGSTQQQSGATRISGFCLNAGIAASMSPEWHFGAAIENASSRKIKDYDPRTFKIGTAYNASPMLTLFLDARQRDRVPEYEDQISLDNPSQSITLSQPERLVIGSAVAMVQDYLRLTASYGQSTTDGRRLLSGGAALISKNFTLSYAASRPYMKIPGAHQVVTLSFEMAM